MTDEPEVVDGVPVLRAETLPTPRSAGVVGVQAAAVAGASFVAGAAAMVVLRGRRGGRRGALRIGGRRKGQRLEVLGSHSFLVDVHVVERR